MTVVDRKQLIIDAATKSFSLFGYKATTMDQVSKIANVGKGTIYTFFVNKEELFKEIVGKLIEDMIKKANSTIDPEKSFSENLHYVLYEILQFRRQHQLMIKLIQEEQEMKTPAVSDMLQEIEDAIVSFISENISIAIKKQYIKQCNPELTAFVAFRLYISLISDWEKHHQPLEKEEIADLFELYFIKGLSKENG
ncbi:TetR/AcrR family transcriptional regulator [Caldibacillus lycopersici]|uniref:TetR/AcrR family transcriptional regulator n=1 Tax=Perspicuibacillus lycopersici TaxID=1325689 RepID=A0AAE3IX17_9BACI|nr:TetR/AcrR family transcriptional regulator [Perspicuibacillus lycopersici]MCU9614959.1 TetR/AcrR family transcriptional regulator [Perspicuibacillus lycopersici]